MKGGPLCGLYHIQTCFFFSKKSKIFSLQFCWLQLFSLFFSNGPTYKKTRNKINQFSFYVYYVCFPPIYCIILSQKCSLYRSIRVELYLMGLAFIWRVHAGNFWRYLHTAMWIQVSLLEIIHHSFIAMPTKL